MVCDAGVGFARVDIAVDRLALFADASIVIDTEIQLHARNQVWKFARRSDVLSDLKIFRKTSCVRSSASSYLPVNLYAMAEDFRQCCRTIWSPASWSPARRR